MPSRRRVLAVLGASGFAGCVGDRNGPTSTDTQSPSDTAAPTDRGTATPTPTPELAAVGDTIAVDGAELTLERVSVQGSMTYVYTDSGGVQTHDGRYVLAEVAVTATGSTAPSASAYSLAVAGRRVSSVDSGGSFWTSPESRRQPYAPSESPDTGGDPGGWLAFPVGGELDAESPRLAIGGGGWRLPERATARLRKPLARYELVSFDHPETVAPDEPFIVSVTAENVGPVTGSFRGVLNAANVRYAYYPHEFALALEPGERATWELEYAGDEGLNDADDSGRFDLRTVAGNREGTVEVDGAAGTEM